jgi:hypothetical protein
MEAREGPVGVRRVQDSRLGVWGQRVQSFPGRHVGRLFDCLGIISQVQEDDVGFKSLGSPTW